MEKVTPFVGSEKKALIVDTFFVAVNETHRFQQLVSEEVNRFQNSLDEYHRERALLAAAHLERSARNLVDILRGVKCNDSAR